MIKIKVFINHATGKTGISLYSIKNIIKLFSHVEGSKDSQKMGGKGARAEQESRSGGPRKGPGLPVKCAIWKLAHSEGTEKDTVLGGRRPVSPQLCGLG